MTPREHYGPRIRRPGRVLTRYQLEHLAPLRWHHANFKASHHRREHNPLAVWRPVRLGGIEHADSGDALKFSARGGDFAQRPPLFQLCRETNPFSIRPPARP